MTRSDGRVIGFDDVGDPHGVPVLFVHGTPDSRRARHPDDSLATRSGVRLVCIDRPGIGSSDDHPTRTVASFADDAVALADHLGVQQWRTFGWSAGSIYALAVAARHPDRVAAAAVVAGLVPFEAYDTSDILSSANGGRLMAAELGSELGAQAFAEMAAPMTAPYPCDHALALEHILEGADPLRRRELAAVPGAAEAMADGVVDAVRRGLAAITRDLELQVEPPDVDWASVTCEVQLTYGGRDTTAPPEFAQWWQQSLTTTSLFVDPEAGHLVALTRWQEILSDLRDAGGPESFR